MQNFICYSLTAFFGVIVLSDAVEATKNTELQIAQQVEPIVQDAIPVAAKPAYADSFSENVAREVFTSVNTASLGLQIAQSEVTKPQNQNSAPSPIQPLKDKASQLWKEAIELSKQPSAASQRQAIIKYEEILKISRLPEVRAVIPQEARSDEASTLYMIANTYGNLNENTKALEYLEQALAISRELKDRLLEARMLWTIGNIYGFNPTEYTKAVGYLEQALTILRESKEPEARSKQGVTLLALGVFYLELGEKQKAFDAYNQALSLYHAENQSETKAQALSGIAGVYDEFGEPKKEREYLDQALAIHKANNDLPGQASTLTSIALNYKNLGETEKALDYHRQALEIYRQTKDLFKQADTLSSIGLVYSSRGDSSSAEKYIQQALELQKTVQKELEQDVKSQIKQIIILKKIAISYFWLGDTQQQIYYLNQGRIIAHELGKTQKEADIISSIGLAYYLLGETQKAKDNFTQALKLQTEIKDFQGEAKTLVNIASIHRQSGEFQQALDILNQALEISKQKQDSSLEGEILSNISDVYRDLGAYGLSIEKSKEVLAIYQQSNPSLVVNALDYIGVAYLASCFNQKKPEDCRQTLDYSNQALKYAHEKASVFDEISILGSITKAYELLEHYPQAIENAEKALELSRKYNLKDKEETALALLSAAYEGAGDHQKALDASKQSLSLSQQLGDLTSQATVYKIQGKIYISMKQPQQAIEVYNQELKLAQQIGDTDHQTYPLYKIAIIERDRGNLNQAKTQIESAINIIETTRSKVNSNDLRTSYFATVQDYYKFYIDLLMQLHKKDPSKGYAAEALHISERSRARGLLELLTEANAKIRKGIDPQLLVEEQNLQQQLDARDQLRQELVNKTAPTTAIQKLEKEIADLRRQYEELQTKIRTSSPKYAALKYPEPLKLTQIQQQLDSDTLLLQYSLGKEHSYLWVVTPNSLDTYELPGQEKIENATNDFRQSLLDRGFDQNLKAAKQLSQIIFAPVANKLGKKRLVIVADGALENIPFAALTDLTSQESYQPLLVNHEIVNLPSASTIAILRQETKGRKAAPKALAILANPVFSADDCRVTHKDNCLVTGKLNDDSSTPEFDEQRSALARAAKNLNRDGWAPLDGTRLEAEAILKLVSPKDSLQAVDFDANYNWVTNPQLSQYRIIHFATHGFADNINPELSGIVLSLIDKQGKPIRGYLRLNDIFNLDLPADLVVLSACNTGRGKQVQGEGLVGLTRGLMYAGSQRVVVSLWSVNDEGTKELMSEFYRQMLQQGKSPTAALRAAQLYLWQQKEWKNPYFWAAFTVQGEWQNNS
ncbi:CHAT domain-containing protein [Nostoc sp. UCD121]|uniref:CHAT domain-containing tetratricopeptide repeat protein n=1 Tax=unclassified Nostoc TaxID=2593658 RepID=UPI00162888F4|nr:MULTISPECIES: CHAT domain-containing protein [unclassified Nostoc]MBC1224702.1 CHAT domain-containing protein [Nostoc sp. UCD120]MBC1275662.1 CHAT domain-containing protein [Nostoc sp. UCD121]MBC1298618.1 CHAT domain-containing protein [Nostoc sp. UCD122]